MQKNVQNDVEFSIYQHHCSADSLVLKTFILFSKKKKQM